MRSPWLALFGLALLSCQGKGPRTDGGGDDTAPTIYGEAVDGEYRRIEDYRGQVVLLNVWATWCEPCRRELPELDALHRKYAADGFTVLGVSVDTERSQPRVRALVGELGLSFPVLLDPTGRSVLALQVVGYPTSFLIGRDGRIAWRRDGLITPGDPELGGHIRTALASPRP